MGTRKILILDDEEGIRRMFRRYLERGGYAVFEADCCTRAQTICDEEDIDAAVFDIMMPGTNGVECLEAMLERHPHIPVVMITAVNDLDTAVDAMKKGAVDYITKPVRKEMLLDTIEKAFVKGEELRRLRPFSVNHVMVLNNAGLVLSHVDLHPTTEIDGDVFGGMFTAIKMFISDSLSSDGELKNINHGDHNIMIESGSNFYLTVIGEGEDSRSLRERMSSIVRRIEEDYGNAIETWNGDMGVFEDLEKIFSELD